MFNARVVIFEINVLSVSSGRIPTKSKNILDLPVHFSRVLGDLIANKNIEYGSWYSNWSVNFRKNFLFYGNGGLESN